MNEIAGWITIGTKLDNKNLEKQLNQQKRELIKYAQEQEKLMQQKSKAEADLKPYQDEINALRKQAQEAEKVRMNESQRKAHLEQLQGELDDINNRYAKQISLYEEVNKKIAENKNNIETINVQIAKTEDLLIEAEKKADLKNNFENIKTSIEKSSKSITGIIKKVSKWALALVGIRGAYTAIRSAMSTLSQYDKQLAANLQYIRYALAMAIKPVVEWIVNAIYQVLSVVGSLVKSFTGVNIFAKASAKSMKSMANSAKEINKALAPFDEANILGSPNGSGDVNPSFDLSGDNLFSNFNIDNFIEKGKEIAIKIAEGINDFFTNTNWADVAQWLSGALIGIIDILITFITTLDWETVGNAIATFLLNINWLEIGGKLIDLIINGMIAGVDLISGVIDGILTALDDPNFLRNAENAGEKILDKIIDGMSTIGDKMEKVWGNIIGFFLKKLGLKENEAQDVGEKIADGLINGVDKTLEVGMPLYKVFKNVIGIAKLVFGIHSPSKEFEDVGEYLMLGLKDGLINEEKNVETEFKKFGSSLIDNLINGIKLRVNSLIDLINSLINKINKSLVFKWNNITIDGVKLLNAGSANVGKIQPIQRFYTGGIVDIPKTGVNIGNVKMGEQGREGILPFTNPNTMAEVGKEIGKWVTINVDLTNTIDGRVLNKRLEQINANDEFARNGAM